MKLASFNMLFRRHTTTIEMSTKAIRDSIAARKLYVKTYNEDRKRIQLAIKGCQEAVSCLRMVLRNSKKVKARDAKLIQLSAKTAAASSVKAFEHLKNVARHLQKTSVARKENAVIRSLIQVSQYGYTHQPTLSKVIELLKKLEQDLWKKLADCHDDEGRLLKEHKDKLVALRKLI